VLPVRNPGVTRAAIVGLVAQVHAYDTVIRAAGMNRHAVGDPSTPVDRLLSLAGAVAKTHDAAVAVDQVLGHAWTWSTIALGDPLHRSDRR
jgi:hypothetical protein